jgi:YHS domain-containing protein
MMLRNTLLALTLALGFGGGAFAGEEYVDKTGFGASGYDVVSYFSLQQSSIGTPQASPLAGKASLVAEYNGAKFAFATPDNLALFTEDPAKFAPQFDGHCAYGVSKGGKVPGNPTLWRIVDGKLYLNITKNVVGFWEADIPGNINLAGGNWGSLESKAASNDIIPNFSSAAPAAN